jgi:hypothetical protein
MRACPAVATPALATPALASREIHARRGLFESRWASR